MRGRKSTGPGIVARDRRKPVALSSDQHVRKRTLPGTRDRVWVLEPAVPGVDAVAWANRHRGLVEAWLWEHGALLFRGFELGVVARFEALVAATSSGDRLEYRDRTTPRRDAGRRIYTSTVHPADQRINLHNEGTYWLEWPRKLYFCCIEAPASGGETPLADVGNVHDHLDPGLRRVFEKRGVMLVRNFNHGFGLPWQEVFQTDSRERVEAYCARNRIEFEWRGEDRLRTRQVRPAVRVHPVSGRPVWFNHAAFFHHTTLEPGIRTAMLDEFGLEGLPYNVCYGDGTAIEEPTADRLREAYAAEEVRFDWQAGDVLLIDNMTVAHAREPYTGSRQVLAAMTEPHGGLEHEQERSIGAPAPEVDTVPAPATKGVS